MQAASTQNVTAVLTQGSVPAYIVELLSGPQAQEVDPLTASNNSGNSANHPYNARIGVLRELHTRKSDRSCLHVELDIQGSGMQYEAGDHVGECNLLLGCSLLCMLACATDKVSILDTSPACFVLAQVRPYPYRLHAVSASCHVNTH